MWLSRYSVFLVLVSSICCPTIASPAPVTVVALLGQQAPGYAEGVTFNGLGGGQIDAAGQVVFHATVPGVPDPWPINDEGLWIYSNGNLASIVRKQDPVTAVGGDAVFAAFSDPIMDGGGITFGAVLQGSGIDISNNSGVFRHIGAEHQLILRTGDILPGSTEPLEGYFALRARNGHFGFVATTASDSPFYAGPAGSYRKVSGAGMPAPGVGGDAVFTSALFGEIDSSGNALLRTGVTGTGIDSSNDSGIWWNGASDEPVLIARTGSQAGGMPAGVDYTTLYMPFIGANGHITFLADTTVSTALFHGTPAGVSPVLEVGAAAPGLGAGHTVAFIDDGVPTSASGRITVFGSIAGADVTEENAPVVWEGPAGALRPVFRAGDHAPGFPEDHVFTYFDFGSLVANDVGQVVFTSDLLSPNGTYPPEWGLWLVGPEGGTPELLLKKGDLIEVQPGSFRELATAYFDDGVNEAPFPYPNVFNDSGQLLLTLNFTDGSSGLFIVNTPEPGGVLSSLLCLGIYLLSVRRGSA